MRWTTVLAVAAALCTSDAVAQKPAEIAYTLTIDSADAGFFAVEMRIPGGRDTLTLAAAAHSEYDDKYWRYVEDLRVTGARGAATVTRVDSVLWRISNAGGDIVVRYRVRPAPQPAPRAAWRAFVSGTGALVGGPHSFLYLVGAENAAATVRLSIPARWQVFTGLERRGESYFAPNIAVLMDSPIFVGTASSWRFTVNDLPHRVAYWRTANSAAFDTVAFVNGIERFVREVIRMFGSAPYKDYTFVFQDSAYGGLEHINSVTLGAPSADLAKDPHAYLAETAHEFFHTWNLMQIRPREYRDLDYKTQPPVAGLWFSEGLTIFYADLLRRRAGLPTDDSTRVQRLKSILERYYSNPGNHRFSAEQVSRVAYNALPGSLGDYALSTHLQGEVLGSMLDLIVRGATNGERSMDDVMRLMRDRFVGDVRFLGSDVERAVTDVCRCDVRPFFDAHVRGGSEIDLDRYLNIIGLRARRSMTAALSDKGEPLVDLRIRAWQSSPQNKLSLLFWTPESIWVKAGLHTNDRLVSFNGRSVGSWAEFRSLLAPLRVGDTAHVVVERPTGPFTAHVAITGYDRAVLQLVEIENASAKQRALRAGWLALK